MTIDRIARCATIRRQVAATVVELLNHSLEWSEIGFRDALKLKLNEDQSLWSDGWYNPPPAGIATLFSSPGDFRRLQFDTLRSEEFWPTAQNKLQKGSAAMIYASPVDRAMGVISDWSTTIYLGDDSVVKMHFKNCLEAMEEALGRIEIGMKFREIHHIAQMIFKKCNLTNARTVTLTDRTGTNLGHTIPWSYEDPTSEEVRAIQGNDFDLLKNTISRKRINVNFKETFKVPETIAFTFEARLEDLENQKLPNVFFHYIVTFVDGRKEILANFNEVFKAVGMDYLGSKY